MRPRKLFCLLAALALVLSVIAAAPASAASLTRLEPADAGAGDLLGTAVDIDGTLLVAGAPADSGGGYRAGAAHVFRLGGGGWEHEAKLVGDDADEDHWFGGSVAVADGRIAVGAPGVRPAGAVYIFEQSGNGWSQTALIAAPDESPRDFGAAVALDGDRLVVGAPPGFEEGGPGAAYAYTHRGGAGWDGVALAAPQPEPSRRFGAAVDVAGDTAIVGAFSTTGGAGAAQVFRDDSGWSHEATLTQPEAANEGTLFGQAVAVSADGGEASAIAGAPGHDEPGENAGSIYLYQRGPDGWAGAGRQANAAAGDQAGSAVAGSVDAVAYGAPGAESDAGRVEVITFDGNSTFTSPTGATDGRFGAAVASSGAFIAIGAPAEDSDAGQGAGAVYVVDLSATGAQARAVDDSCPAGEVEEDGYGDAESSVHEATIDCVVWWEIARGVADSSYAPARGVTRAQMATFLRNVLEATDDQLPDDPGDHFGDDDRSVHEQAINVLAELGIVSGTGPRTYSPGRIVTRAQMATFLVRTFEYRAHRLGASQDHFSDDDGTAHEENINRAAEAGFTGGTGSGYAPGRDVSRDQMATFLARVLDLFVEEGFAAPPG